MVLENQMSAIDSGEESGVGCPNERQSYLEDLRSSFILLDVDAEKDGILPIRASCEGEMLKMCEVFMCFR